MTDKPRCPLRVAGFDQPDTCDENCAWLINKTDCAIARMVSHANDDLTHESDVRASDVDANDGEATQDSREKLEADIREWLSGKIASLMIREPYERMFIEWLDRQAAIDERYWKSQVDALVSKGEMLADENTRLRNEIAELQANLNRANDDFESARAELEEEVDELQDQLESAHAKNRALKAHISKMQEGRHGWHIKGKELQEKVDSLTQANGDLRDEWHRVCRERDELRRELTNSNRERERLRKQLGIAIDHAHDMIALVSVDTDEGAE